MKLKMTKEIVIKSKFKRNAKFHQGVMHNVNVTIRKINRKKPQILHMQMFTLSFKYNDHQVVALLALNIYI